MTATVRGISVGTREGSENLDSEREYSVVYKVYTDDKADGAKEVLGAFGVPEVGSIYIAGNDSDFSAVVINKTATENSDSPFEWLVEVTYSTDVGREPKEIENPLFADPEISYGFQARRILIPGSYNDPLGPPGDFAWQQGIFAPNGELFDPQPEWEVHEPVLTIKRNVQSISGAAFMILANCVNLDFYEGAQPRQLKMNAPTAVRKWHKQCGHYWEATFGMAYRWETWDLQILNQGTYYFSGGKPTSVWSTTQARLTKPDASGNPLLVNLSTNGDINTSATPTFTRKRIAREINFGALNLLGSGPISF